MPLNKKTQTKPKQTKPKPKQTKTNQKFIPLKLEQIFINGFMWLSWYWTMVLCNLYTKE